MARNPVVIKMRRQRVQRRRGTFKQFSQLSTVDADFNSRSNGLAKFWAENVRVRDNTAYGIVPREMRGLGTQRHTGDITHTLGVHSHAKMPPRAVDLTVNAFFKQATSTERQAIEAILPPVAVEDIFASVIVERTRFSITRMFYNGPKTCVFFVQQDKYVLRGSITYGSADRAKEVFRQSTITWKAERVYTSSQP